MSLSQLSDEARYERANRGKYAEGKVREALKVLALGNKDFDFERKYDARASRGRIPSQTGDFGWYSINRHGVIEVKQVGHDFRLPKKNFDPAKWGRLRLRRMAGGEIGILVYHSTTKLWRAPSFDFFLSNPDAPSWDLSGLPAHPKVLAAVRMLGLTVPA